MLFLCETITFSVQYRTSHLSNNGCCFYVKVITFPVQYRTSHLSNNGSCFYVKQFTFLVQYRTSHLSNNSCFILNVKQLLFLYNIVHHIYQIMEVVFK